eukprot:353142-Chlamydomonas_euryale.AAC.4
MAWPRSYQEVGAQPLWRLRRHLGRALQDRDGEVRVGAAGQPQPEVGVRRLGLERLDKLVKLGQPAGHEVAVGEEHPRAFAQPVLDQPRRHRRLALPKRDRVKARQHALLRRELAQRVGRVHAGRQHKDERRRRRRVGVRLAQVQHRRLDKLAAHGVGDVRRGGEDDAVRAQAAHHDHALQLCALGLPLRRHLGRLRLVLAVPSLPLALAAVKALHDAGKVGQRVKLRDVVPRLLRDPRRRGVGRLLRAVKHRATLQHELPLVGVDLVRGLQDAHTDLQAQQQLVALKESACGVFVHSVRVVVVEQLDALRQRVALGAVADGDEEEVGVRVEAELVHGVDCREVVEHKVEHRRAHRARPVLLARDLNLL